MKVLNKYIPYFYFIIAGLLLMRSIQESQEEKERYEILFSFETESTMTFLIARVVFILLIVLAGIARIKRTQNNE